MTLNGHFAKPRVYLLDNICAYKKSSEFHVVLLSGKVSTESGPCGGFIGKLPKEWAPGDPTIIIPPAVIPCVIYTCV